MRFHQRLRQLGFQNYAEYLASALWFSFRRRYAAAKRPFLCAVCGVGPVQLHHHTYRRLGKERVTDVTPLCDAHHEQVHRQLDARGWEVDQTCRIVTELQHVNYPRTGRARPYRPSMTPAPTKAKPVDWLNADESLRALAAGLRPR